MTGLRRVAAGTLPQPYCNAVGLLPNLSLWAFWALAGAELAVLGDGERPTDGGVLSDTSGGVSGRAMAGLAGLALAASALVVSRVVRSG